MAFLAGIIIIGIYFKRRQQARQRFTIDSDDSLAGGDTEAEEVPGTLTPFTFHPLNMLSRPKTKSPATAVPSTHTQDQRNSSQDPTSAALRADSEGRIGDTLVDIMQNMQNIQQRLLHIEGQLTGGRAQNQEQNRQRLRRTSTTGSVENPFETPSEGTSDAPPTYISAEVREQQSTEDH